MKRNPSQSNRHQTRLYAALEAVADEADALRRTGQAGQLAEFPPLPPAGTLRMLPRAAYFAESVAVTAHQAIGRLSADSLAAYPPGIPNVIPGEEITEQTVAFLRAVAASPTGYVRGAIDPEVSRFRVVRER